MTTDIGYIGLTIVAIFFLIAMLGVLYILIFNLKNA